jgi:L-aminopeptidase/D-esterase-like protein
MLKPGSRNLITDVPGLAVGNAAEPALRTGVTVVLCEDGAVAGADTRGGAPGTRETDLLRPDCLVDRIDAVALAGGSVHGLAAADAVVDWLASHGRGFPVGPHRMPIVPGAIVFDLGRGGADWRADPPYRRLASEACEAAAADFALGNAGAGFGAMAGRLKGGLGSASALDDALAVGALVVANPVGATTMPDGAFWAWPFERDAEFGGRRPSGASSPLDDGLPAEGRLAGHTTIAVVATDAILDKAEAQRVALMAQDGLARAIRPVHTPLDGDVVFALATGRRPLQGPRGLALARLGSIAADCQARSVARAVWAADDLGDMKSWRTVYGEKT